MTTKKQKQKIRTMPRSARQNLDSLRNKHKNLELRTMPRSGSARHLDSLRNRKTHNLKLRKRLRPTLKKKKPIRHRKVRIEESVRQTKIRLIGVGGGGGSIVSEIASRMKKADFVVANTDSRALRKVVKKVKRFQFGQDLTHGLGTGMNVEMGEIAAQDKKEKIKKLFEGQDVCIIVASLGGGTGSGAVPIFAKISKNLNCLTYGIFTLPFEFEGEKKMEIAKESLRKVKSHLNIYSVIPNERIFQIIDKNAPLKNALSAINQKLAGNLEGLIEMIYLPGLINIDFADLKTILTGRAKLAYLNVITVETPNKEEPVKKVISSPLYPYTTKRAKGVLYNIVGDKALQLSEVSQISKIISESIDKKAKIIFGINQNQKLQDKIKITLLAVGCGMKGILIKPSQVVKSPVSKSITPKRDALSKKPSKKPSTTLVPKKVKGKSKKSITTKGAKTKTKPKTKLKKKPKEKKPLRGQKKQTSLKITKPKKKPKKSKSSTPPAVAGGVESQKKPEEENKLEKEKSLDYNQQFQGLRDGKVRRSGLQVKEAVEEQEKEILEREKIWETPAIFRRKSRE